MNSKVIAFEIKDTNFQNDIELLISKLEGKFPFLILLHRNFYLDYCDNTISTLLNELREVFSKTIIIEIPQKSLSLHSIATLEIHYFNSDSNSYESLNIDNTQVFTSQNDDSKFCCIVTSHSGIDKYSQCFESISAGFRAVNFKYSDIIRQWNYLPNIFENDSLGNEEYATFNSARSKAYSEANMNYYPAATGIGVDGDNAVIIAFALQCNQYEVVTIENPLQVSAFKYSSQVLKPNAELSVKQPLFSRGLIVLNPNDYTFYISGTASIRGELTIGESSVEEQLERTLENIEALTDESNVLKYISTESVKFRSEPCFLKVYLQNKSDLNKIQEIIQNKYLKAEIVYVQANICRRELLIEIEGII